MGRNAPKEGKSALKELKPAFFYAISSSFGLKCKVYLSILRIVFALTGAESRIMPAENKR